MKPKNLTQAERIQATVTATLAGIRQAGEAPGVVKVEGKTVIVTMQGQKQTEDSGLNHAWSQK